MSLTVTNRTETVTSEPVRWNCEPIKVVHVYRNHILAGEGNSVLIWLVGEHSCPRVVKIFPEGCAIMSLSCITTNNEGGMDVLATSLHFYRKFSLKTNNKHEIQLGPMYEAKYGEAIAGHCLESGAFIIYDLNNTAVLHEFDGVRKQETTYKGQLGAPDCVTITGHKKSDILIFVATSSRVSICKLLDEIQSDGQQANVLHSIYTFCQPKVGFSVFTVPFQGVIFTVHFYPESNLILTTSDDRSVSLWKCDFDRNSGQLLAPVTLQASLEGHTSRVFDAMLIPGHVISVGEDSSVVAWSLQNLTQHRVIGNHAGCTIWSCAYDAAHGSIYTSGDNGSIFKWDVAQVLQNYELSQNCELYPAWIYDHKGIEIEPKSKQDYPRLVRSFDLHSSVVTTNSGKILVINSNTLQYSNHAPPGHGYLTFSWFPCKTMYVLGTMSGLVIFNSIDQTCLSPRETTSFVLPIPEKILSIHFLSNDVLIISTVTSLLKYNLSIANSKIPQPLLQWSVKQKSNTNCITAWNNVLFVGLDNGKIKSYNLATGGKLYEFKARHNKYGVGGMVEYEGQLVTGGRDSSLNFFFIEADFGETDEELGLKEPVTHLKTVPLPFLWVGTLIKYRGDLLVCGFESADFVVYSLKRGQIIGRAECGGAHRAWDFIMTQNGTGVFTHIRLRRVYKTCLQLDHCITNALKEGFHTEFVNSLVEIPNSLGTATVIVSGSEDGAVKVSTFEIDTVEEEEDVGEESWIRFVKSKTDTICNHSSGVKCLHYQELRSNEGYLFSGGGRSEIVLTQIFLEGVHLKKYRHVRRFQFENTIDFRVMDIRSMTLPSPEDKSPILLVFVACSDGLLRILRENGTFKFSRSVRKCTGSKHCLTSVEIISSDIETTIFAGTSNGNVICWRVDHHDVESWHLEVEPCRIFNLGRIAITSMTLIENVTIMMGSDDGSLYRVETKAILDGDSSNLKKINVANDNILGLKYRSNVDSIYFASGGILYKTNVSWEKMESVKISIQDGKGIEVCKPIKYCDRTFNPFVSFGKGVSVFTLK